MKGRSYCVKEIQIVTILVIPPWAIDNEFANFLNEIALHFGKLIARI
jgi:hypothetical protein